MRCNYPRRRPKAPVKGGDEHRLSMDYIRRMCPGIMHIMEMKQVAKTCERNGATDGNINSMRSLANWVQAGSLTGDYSKAAEWTIVSGATTDPDTRKQLLQDVANYQF